jgi:hypothetical protein
MLDANKARGDLKEILNTDEYQAYYHQAQNPFTLLWERAKQWIAEQLIKLFPALKSAGNAAGPVLILVIAAVLILLGLSIFLIVRNVRRSQKFKDRKPLQSLQEINWTYERHLQEAKNQEANGELGRATRHLFLALLLYCHEKEWLEAKIWKTNWDYYEELKKSNQPHAKQFFNLAAFFEEVTYGKRTVEKEEYHPYRTQIMKWFEDVEGGLKQVK